MASLSGTRLTVDEYRARNDRGRMSGASRQRRHRERQAAGGRLYHAELDEVALEALLAASFGLDMIDEGAAG